MSARDLNARLVKVNFFISFTPCDHILEKIRIQEFIMIDCNECYHFNVSISLETQTFFTKYHVF